MLKSLMRVPVNVPAAANQHFLALKIRPPIFTLLGWDVGNQNTIVQGSAQNGLRIWQTTRGQGQCSLERIACDKPAGRLQTPIAGLTRKFVPCESIPASIRDGVLYIKPLPPPFQPICKRVSEPALTKNDVQAVLAAMRLLNVPKEMVYGSTRTYNDRHGNVKRAVML